MEKEPIKVTNKGDYLVQSYVRWDEIIDYFWLQNYMIRYASTNENIYDYSGEAVSYFITSVLHRFPKKNENLVLDIQENQENGEIVGHIDLLVVSCCDTKIHELKCRIHRKYTNNWHVNSG